MSKKILPNTTKKQEYDYIIILRYILLIIIILTGITLSILCYYYIRKYQYIIYNNNFNNIINNNYKLINESIYNKLQLNIQLAINYGFICSTISQWPNCTLSSKQFIENTNSLISVTKVNDFGILPIVQHSNKDSFESYALNYYQNDGGYSNQTGCSSFGSGMYGIDSDGECYPSIGYNNFSNYNMYVPVLQIANIKDESLILFDTYSNLDFALIIDEMIDCANQIINTSTEINTQIIQQTCSGMTEYVSSINGLKYVAIGTPILPVNNNSYVVGFSAAFFSWSSILSSISNSDSNFQIVIESSSPKSTKLVYEVNDGIVKETKKVTELETSYDFFDHNLQQKYVVDSNTLFTTDTTYTITYYSTNKIPSKNVAIISSICCFTMTLLISIIFEIFHKLIQKRATKAASLLESKRSFVRFISHEIRTPLSTIMSGLKLLMQEIDLLKDTNLSEKSDLALEECVKIIDDIFDNGDVAVTTLNDLINYDKIESNAFTIEENIVNIWHVIEKTVSLLQIQAKEKEVELKLTSQLLTPSHFPQSNINLNNIRIHGDNIKLGQVVRNLVSNALKFTPKEGKVSISAHFESQPVAVTSPRRLSLISFQPKFDQVSTIDQMSDVVGNLVITVTDTGPGLTSDQIKHMFKEGVQFNPNQLQGGGGSGYGLWISKEIVKLHHGTIQVKSPGLGRGSRFEVTLPAIQVENSDERATPSSLIRYINVTQYVSEAVKSTHNSPNEVRERYILIVDDAASNRKIVSRLLQKKGYTCHEADNGSECVEMVLSKKVSYDFILLDYEMPILNGPSAARQLRANKCDVSIVGVTSNVLPEDQQYFLAQGADLVLSKPLNVDELIEKVRNIEVRP